MMKFREDRIGELEKQVKAGASEDLNNLVKEKEKEIEVRLFLLLFGIVSLLF